MRKRLVGLLAGAVSCSRHAGQQPARRRRHRRRQPSQPATSEAPASAAPSEGGVDLDQHGVRACRGHGRRLDHHRRLAGSQPVQPVLPRARSPRPTSPRPCGATLLVFTQRLSVRARTSRPTIPTPDNGGVKAPGDGGDAMTVTWTLRDGLKWSDGEPLTCDDFKYAWEWVLDPDNVGVITAGLQGHQRRRVRLGHRDGLALRARSTRATSTLVDRAAAAPLPGADPDRGPGQRRRLPGRGSPEPAGQRRVQVRVGHAAAGAAPGPQRQLHELRGPASRPTSTTSSGSGTATPTS